MDYLNFYNYNSFVDAVLKECSKIKDYEDSIAIIAKYDDARKIIMQLVQNGFILKEISALESPECSGYHDEFIISICNFDGDFEIWCEPMKYDDTYIDDESLTTFVLSNCSSRIIPHCDAQHKYDVRIGEEGADNHSPLPCSRCTDEDGQHWFSVSKNDEDGYSCFSFYTSENLSKEDIEDLMKNLQWN